MVTQKHSKLLLGNIIFLYWMFSLTLPRPFCCAFCRETLKTPWGLLKLTKFPTIISNQDKSLLLSVQAVQILIQHSLYLNVHQRLFFGSHSTFVQVLLMTRASEAKSQAV